MSKWLTLVPVLAACSGDPEPPALVPWTVHAMSVADSRTLIVAGTGSSVPAGSIQTLGTEIPGVTDPSSGTPLDPMVPTATGVAAGTHHACALSTQQVYCWGDHEGGALGAHRECTPPTTEGGAPNCRLGAAVMPTLPPIRAVAAGNDVTCATGVDDRVYCWGDPALAGGSKVPALDPPLAVHLPDGAPLLAQRVDIRGATVCAIDRAQTAWCWGGSFGDRPRKQDFTNVLDFALGPHHGCVLTTTGLTCWGDNRNGQVGRADHARTCGEGPCTLGATKIELDAMRVVVGERHTCALLRDGAVACWGSNEVGQLGRDDAFLVGDVGIALGGAVDVASSYARTCALLADGSAWCWGEHVTTY